jgi:two-component system response regulator RstA
MNHSFAAQKTIFLLTGWKKPNLAVIQHLHDDGYCVEQIVGWREAVVPLPHKEPDLVLLDFDLSHPESFTALVKIREAYQGPLAVLSEHPDETIHIRVLDLGADDFMGGPVSHGMLTARIKTLLRRRGCGRKVSGSTIRLGGLTIDASRREVFLHGKPIDFTTVEFNMLWYLARNAGTVVSRNDIHLTIYNREYNGVDRSIDMYISRLRQKLGDDHAAHSLLKTVRGMGYLMSGHRS